MSASRIASSAQRLFHRYQVFFFIAFLLVSIQMYLGYSFYSISQGELRQLEQEWYKKTKLHGIDKLPYDDEDLQQDSVQDAGGGHFSNNHITHRPPPSYNHPNSLNKNSLKNHVNAINKHDTHNSINISHHQSPVKYVHKDDRGDLKYVHQDDRGQIYNVDIKDNAGKIPERENPGNSPRFSPTCVISETDDKEAYSALQRANTVECKQEIADVVCKQRKKSLFSKQVIPTYCSLRTPNKGIYKGCYRDDQESRVLPVLSKTFPNDNTIDKCINICLTSGFEYAGVEWGLECWCSDKFNDKRTGVPLPEEECISPCPGDSTKACGGFNAISVYMTGAGARMYYSPPLVDPDDLPSDVPKARIVFILTLNGRALRQVKRLIRSLYHVDHYLLIHVDSRQEYLHRELSVATAGYRNIRLMPERFSTIWGGANLLTMLLKCMEYLFNQTDWKWDFFINLSESDYPVRPVDQLVAFLSTNQDKNFLKAHGKDTPRFIQKQGLERMFIQCENRMWRVGLKELPSGIRIDGGSDWVALNREFCQYLVTSTDDLVNGLLEYWKYTLLPGESFWHTVLQNSKFCTTFANNNLHLVNWNRKKGCKCQYKAIVDWCGCSPNDFTTGDMVKFMQMHEKKKIVFFARKFEAIVNQEIINQLDAFLYGSFPDDTPGLASYWENKYTIDDVLTSLDDSHRTFYHTFVRGAMRRLHETTDSLGACVLEGGQEGSIHSVTVYQQADVFQGLLVKFEAVDPRSGQPHALEVWLQYQRMFSLHSRSHPLPRLKLIDVGTNFDPKEEIFRNHGSLMGPHSNFVVALHWAKGDEFKVTVAIVDPAQVVAATFDLTVAPDEQAQPIYPEFERPLRPGIWTVKLQYMWNVVAEAHFLITPYSHYGGRPITNGEAVLLHQGPLGFYKKDQDFSNAGIYLDLDDVKFAEKNAHRNSQRTGKELLGWIDDLTFKFWSVHDICAVSPVPRCSKISLCETTHWSSFSPDPKSELGEVNPHTGRIR